MPLADMPIPIDGRPLPPDVRRFLAEAAERVTSCGVSRPSFIPSDAEAAYRALSGLDAASQPAGRLFCEWGSGLGVAASLAARLGFLAHAIEIDGELVAAGRALSESFELDVEHVAGTFVPTESQDLAAVTGDELEWLQPGGADAYELLERSPDEFDVVYAYPWPGEEEVIDALFERHAGRGALLLTYHGREGLRARRAVV